MQAFWKRMVSTSLGTVLLILLIMLGSAFAYWNFSGRVVQPILFNHRLHVTQNQIECSTCHVYYSQSQHSGLPDASVCMTCHSDALTKSPEEAKLRDLALHNKPVAFRKLFHLPPHVYYSHRRHVVAGKLECTNCHGGIANTETPPTRPLVSISMNFCVGCHQKSKVSTDCKDCHR